MKKIYKMIGLLIVVALVIVGCSSEESEPMESEVEEPSQSEDDIAEEEEVDQAEEVEEPVEEPEEEEQEETADESGQEIKSKVLRDIMNMDQYTMKMRRITNMGGQVDRLH